jgi:hypothetical protein
VAQHVACSSLYAFLNDERNTVDHSGLRLHLVGGFTCKRLAREEMGDEDADIYISGIQLCRYVDTAESKVRQALRTESLGNNVKKRKRSTTPLDEIQSSDEAKYTKCADCDIDYQDNSSTKSLSD